MDMIRHETPCDQAIALTIEMKQRILNYGRDSRLLQPTCSKARVQFLVYAMDVGFAM